MQGARVLYLAAAILRTRGEQVQFGDWLTTKETAKLLKVSHYCVSAWLSQGKLTRTKAGGRTLIAKADIEAFLRRDGGRAGKGTEQ